MEKIIELLNEWSKTAIENKCNWTDVYDEEWVYFLNLFDRDMTMEMEDVISKRNWFIKWLVDNDKIDRERMRDRWGNMICHFTDEDLFIMSLATSYTPIDDLISYLK